jgi:hypothetical protein
MIDFTHYIKAKSDADTYLNHIKDLNGTPKKQHFLARLSLCNGYRDVLIDNRTRVNLFHFTLKELTKHLGMSFDELWKESMEKDEYGYKKEIKEYGIDDIKFYFGMTQIIGEVCILLRNNIELPDGVEKKINRTNLLRMIEIANNDETIREKESTTYVNGIGGIICLKWLKNSLVPLKWDTIYDCYKKIFAYYIDICTGDMTWLKNERRRHNNIYGLTHCIINLTNFYTKQLNSLINEMLRIQVNTAVNICVDLIDHQRLSNYSMFNDDTLAEMLLCIKLGGKEMCIERINALDALSLRFNSQKLILCAHKATTLKEELLANEHTNILYILNVLL